MGRREFMAVVGGAATFIPLSAWAQQSQAPLIGVLNAASAETMASSIEALRAALSRLGYVEGRNIRFEFRYADGFLDRLPALPEELGQLNPRVIVSGPLPAPPAVPKAPPPLPARLSPPPGPAG